VTHEAGAAFKNERFGEALKTLERAGRLRALAGWRECRHGSIERGSFPFTIGR
jgi:hypothetical protein